MHIKKDLGFAALRSTLSKRLLEIKDNRQNGKVKHSLHDCFMSSFAMMYFQDPSLLSFQRRMQEVNQRNNLMTMFNVSNIPMETQLRNVDGTDKQDCEMNAGKRLIRKIRETHPIESFCLKVGKIS
ncbi:MAG: hypothetical protein HZA08_07855 [Nitrospirae bacterium]|nr:hypothetical protein [Nitrospirota bacterium]